MKRTFVSFTLLWGLLFCLTACIPHSSQPVVIKPVSHLLADHVMFSQIRLIPVQSEVGAGKVFTLAGQRFKKETERLLRKQQRWQQGDGLNLHVEIEKVVLRKDAAVLLFQPLAGVDQMRVKVWVTQKSGTVLASESVSSSSDAGGTYNGLNARRRLQLLADQVARKLVKRL